MVSEPAGTYPQTFYEPPEGSTQVLLVRHGQSAPYVPGSPFDLVDGHGDPHLTERGHHQAELLADRLKGEGVGAIYTTTLTRTKQTAAPLARDLGLDPIVEPDLREVFLGEAEGGRFREMVATGHPRAVEAIETGEWGLMKGAETAAELSRRTVRGVKRIVADNPGRLVVAICHGGVIAVLLGHAAGTGPNVFRGARHTSINHLVVPPGSDGDDWVIRSFNDGAHSGLLTNDFDPPFPSLGRRISSH